MINRFSLVFTFALLINSFIQSAALAMSTDRIEGKTDENGFNILLGKDMNAPNLPLIEERLAEDGTKKIFILSESGSKGASGSDAHSAFGWSLPMLSQWKVDRALTETLKDEKQSEEEHTPIAKRDMDNKLLRCMIGRVYRPCWKD